jgi:polyribonucleotide nucleotidyltransferase
VLSVGQKIQVEITKVDDRGKLSLSPVTEESEAAHAESVPVTE